MRISQLAARSGVPATTLRFYESAGLLPADRTPAGHRVYGEDAVDRLAFIGAAKHLGLPLDEVAALLAVRESGTCAEVKADLRPRVAARIAEATARTAELAAFTGALRRSLDHLDALPAERAGAVAELAAAEQRCCPFLDFVLRLDGPRLHLRVQAPSEGAALLAELFGPPA
ncbi:MerR family transcriptional regulator [Streptomyces sp. NPDC054784]